MPMVVLRFDVPVVPDADTARSWAGQELSGPIYHQQQSLLARLMAWIEKMVTDAASAAQHLDWRLAAIVLTVVVVIGPVTSTAIPAPTRTTAVSTIAASRQSRC